ncbi:MAG TPA: carboxypeptidase-like regulatory domain-containing protein, partial [Vicinamibacterales bacterium]|nr:carboxypeptidase-like regulatory domain-containing protein [Vicinamibacterales bacterium]
MRSKLLVFAGVGLAATLVLAAGQTSVVPPAIDNDDIGGVVSGPRGPEAGVWVIAETKNTPTRLIKSVVTDDQGRFVIPDLPKGEYDVWVRGYGLVDSPKTKASPGKVVNFKAVPAPDKKAAAQYYPAQYWFALMQMPPKGDFPGTGDSGNGISPSIRSQGEWIRQVV